MRASEGAQRRRSPSEVIMRWANFLHIYQPADQQPDILQAVVTQSYRPILKGLIENKDARLTLNINGSLLELFDRGGYKDILDMLRMLVQRGQVEITCSAKYHALLPFLEEKEIIRQVKENQETLKHYFGPEFKAKGFFPPEMAYSERVGKIIAELGFEWMIIDEIGYNGKQNQLKYDRLYKLKDTNLLIFFRERNPSNLIMSAVVRSYDSLKESLGAEFDKERYLLTGMDGETFGHHRPGLEKMLLEIFTSSESNLVQISDLPNFYKIVEEISPIKSTWASSQEDIENNTQFLSWDDPENEIHHYQHDMVNLALKSLYSIDEKEANYGIIRKLMDKALASDHFWWASAKPWWSLEEIERGAFACLEIIRNAPSAPPHDVHTAQMLYEKIVSTAFNWKRTGKIFQLMQERHSISRIPFKERTFEKGGHEEAVYQAFIDMLKGMEKKAAEKGEYEKAILWRDAVWKIENKSDIYDTVHAIELLRLELPHNEIEKTLDKYTEEYYRIRGGQPEQRK